MNCPRAVPSASGAMPACNADNPACKAPIAESLVLSFLCCATSEPVWPATFALTRLVTSDDTSSDALPVEPLMTDCAADALAEAAAAVVSAALEMALAEVAGAEVTGAGAGTLEALDVLEIVDIKMLRTSGLLLSLDGNRPLKASLRGGFT